MAKSMHKKCFHNTFEVVETPIEQSICLDWVDDALSFVPKVLVHGKEVKDRVEDQRTQILKKEKCAIGNLWAEVLEHYC